MRGLRQVGNPKAQVGAHEAILNLSSKLLGSVQARTPIQVRKLMPSQLSCCSSRYSENAGTAIPTAARARIRCLGKPSLKIAEKMFLDEWVQGEIPLPLTQPKFLVFWRRHKPIFRECGKRRFSTLCLSILSNLCTTVRARWEW